MRPRSLLAFGNFFSVAHFYLIIFILAPYLSTFMPAEETGLVISAGALVTLVMFPLAPRLVKKFGARRLAIYFGTAEIIALIMLAAHPVPVVAIVFAAIATAISPLIAYQLDLLLEATVMHIEESSTGSVRTAFLTAGNIALIIAPLIAGYLLDGNNAYYRVFLVAALSLLPFLILFGVTKIPEGTPPAEGNMRKAWKLVLRTPDLYSVLGANAILQFFYHSAPLFIPLYLHNALGIPWGTLGWMFALMLLPFVLLEYPAGVLADRALGDRALLAVGFLIMGLSLALIGFLDASSPLFIILLVLIATRVGASLVESMTEGHFFRRVSEQDTEVVSLFRMARPFSALLAPLVGSIILAMGGYQTLFVLIGSAILVAGAAATVGIKNLRRSAVGIRPVAPPNLPILK